jgi:1-acyl-sn-glycerol-3-phosphate acyltransferase
VTEPAEAVGPRAGESDEGHGRLAIALDGHVWGEQLTLAQRAWYRFLWLLVQLVSRTYFRLRTRGLEKVPTTGAFIVAPNHRSNLDTPLVGALTRRRLRYMGKEEMWKNRFGSWFFTMAGGFPVARGTVDRGALRACVEVVDRGEPLVVFPEGTRQRGPEIQELYDGPAYIAAKTGAPILPVGIGGSERAMGKGMKFPYPARMTLVVGDLIPAPVPLEGKHRVSRAQQQAATAALKEELQRLFDEAQELAGTPNPPRSSTVPPAIEP